MNLNSYLQQGKDEHEELLAATFSNTKLKQAWENWVQWAVEGYASKTMKIFFCGNGGSAADAQHLAAELSGRFERDRAPLYAEALHVNSSYLTAVANDFGYEAVYERAVHAFVGPGDMLVAISTSGRSQNILRAANAARESGAKIVALTGQSGNPLHQIANSCLAVPSTRTARIQEMHMLLGHLFCQAVENEVFPNA
jgi:D-sedoheptulose 7-phosphate isomerase